MSAAPQKKIALLVDTATGWGRNIIRGVDRYAREMGDWDLTLQPYSQVDYIPVPVRWKGDGIIARVGSERMARDLAKTGLPIVNVSSLTLEGYEFPRVISNFRGIGQMAADHFIDQGFTHFGFCAPEDPPAVAQTIYEGFAAQLAAQDFECGRLALAPGRGHPEKQQDAVIDWLDQTPRPMAILAWSIEAPHVVIQACYAAGIAIPDEVAVLSSASLNELILQVMNPAVSCVVTPESTIGHEAARILNQMIDDEVPVDATSVTRVDPTHIEIRASSDVLQIDDRIVVKAIRFIQDNATKGIQVQDVARHAGLSRRSLEERMRRYIRRSPAEEIRLLRLNRARELLEGTSLPIPEVAERAGFGTVEHFIVFFKKATGLTPLQYAKRNRLR